MRPLIVSANDLGGGAGIAAYRLHQGLLGAGVQSEMFVQRNMSGSPIVHKAEGTASKAFGLLQARLDRAPVKWFGPANELFHPQWVPGLWQRSVKSFKPDVINLHWICDGFQRIEAIGHYDVPIVWTLHDMWPMTGGCHYAGACERYHDQCGQCPTLNSSRDMDMSRWVWRRKQHAWRNSNMVIVTPSRWMADCARKSQLFCERRIQVIPNGINLDRFKPIDKLLARQILGLPAVAPLVLFGAMSGSTRKGAHHLKSALQQLQQDRKDIELVIFGNRQQQQELSELKTHYLGQLSDEVTLCLAYAAADVFVAPSEQDNLPNTMIESLACGTPCVAFDIGGMSDIIDTGKTGYLARPFDACDLAQGINLMLGDAATRRRYAEQARQKAQQCFGLGMMADRYAALFAELACMKPTSTPSSDRAGLAS